jgi:hypothetical protein
MRQSLGDDLSRGRTNPRQFIRHFANLQIADHGVITMQHGPVVTFLDRWKLWFLFGCLTVAFLGEAYFIVMTTDDIKQSISEMETSLR